MARTGQERLDLITDYVADNEELPEGALTGHAIAHMVVENQIAMDVEAVPATIGRLIRQGLNRHEAVHAVGAVLLDDVWDLGQHPGASWNPASYRRRLEKLTAKRWRKGKY
ncbi:hypothetical protein [Endothiovibrio diazotrophicus]